MINNKVVAKYTIDGNVIKQGIRCDFLLLNNTDQEAYYIEIKGSDLEHAKEQVEKTEKDLALNKCGYGAYYRIIYRTGTHDVNSSKVNNWKMTCGTEMAERLQLWSSCVMKRRSRLGDVFK